MDVRTVAVIGAGTMGAGIAQVCAQTGWQTNLFDAYPEGLERGMNTINEFWDNGIARGKTTPEQKEEWSANIHTFSDMRNAVKDVDLVIEAVAERLDIKHAVYNNIVPHLKESVILTSNTSGIISIKLELLISFDLIFCFNTIDNLSKFIILGLIL